MAKRGSRTRLDLREEAFHRSLTANGDIICVPWTGIDASYRYICPGFEYTIDRGLIAYVVPLDLMQQRGLIPGVGSTPVDAGLSSSKPPSAIGSLIPAPSLLPIGSGKVPPGSGLAEYLELLKQYLRVVKIAGPEVHSKIYPNANDYYVVVRGPYDSALIGHLMARPDPSGRRFLVADGDSASTRQKQLLATQIVAPDRPAAPAVAPRNAGPAPVAPPAPPPIAAPVPVSVPSVPRTQVSSVATQILTTSPGVTQAGTKKKGRDEERNR